MGNLVEIPNVNYGTLVDIEEKQKNTKDNKTKSFNTFNEKNYLNTKLGKGEKKKEMRIRLLPNPDQAGFSPFIKVHTHTLSNLPKEVSESGFKSYICLEKSEIDNDVFGKKCPFCENQRVAYKQSLEVAENSKNRIEELEKEYNSTTDALRKETIAKEIREIRETSELKKKALQKLSLSNMSRETVIMRVIERGKEEEGPKFWKVNVSRRGDDAYSLIRNLAERLYKEGVETGSDENLFDSFKGRDIIITITGSDNDRDNKTSISVTQALSQTPISKDENKMREWIYDTKKWSDVFVIKPYEYLSVISTGEIPWFDRETGKWIPKSDADKKRDAYNSQRTVETNASIEEAEAVVTQMFIDDGDDELPF